MRLLILLLVLAFQSSLLAEELEGSSHIIRRVDTYLLFGSTIAPKTAYRTEFTNGSTTNSSSGEDKDKPGFAFGVDTVVRINPFVGFSLVADAIRYKYKDEPAESMLHLGIGPRIAGISGDFEFWGSVLVGYSVNKHAKTSDIEDGMIITLTEDRADGVQVSYRVGVDYTIADAIKLRLQGSYATVTYDAAATVHTHPGMVHIASAKGKFDRSYGMAMMGVAIGF